MLGKRAHHGSSIYRQCYYVCTRCQISQSRLRNASLISSLEPFSAVQTRRFAAAANFKATIETGEPVSFPDKTGSALDAEVSPPNQSRLGALGRIQRVLSTSVQRNPKPLPKRVTIRHTTLQKIRRVVAYMHRKQKSLTKRSNTRRIGPQTLVRKIYNPLEIEPSINREDGKKQPSEVLEVNMSLEDALIGQPRQVGEEPAEITEFEKEPENMPRVERRDKARASPKKEVAKKPLKIEKRKNGVSAEEIVNTPSAELAGYEVKMKAKDIKFIAIHEDIPPVPRLAHGLQRVLFNRGVYQFRDLHSRVYNFDPSLELITPVNEIDFNSLKGFTPSSEDSTLTRIAKKNGKKYVGSTSSMTGILKHFHFLLSEFRPLNMDMLSTQVRETLPATFTKITAAPDAVFLRWKNGTYAIDSDKEFDSNNVLSFMGRFMEKLLTVDKAAFERHKKGQPNPITDEELQADESHHYSTIGDILMRSQLDAYDPRLPGTGMFDLKTRAVMPIRMNSSAPESLIGYELREPLGMWESFEREYADMMRSTLLKYSLQARMGRMDGIFVAYHNITRLFGFQYLSLNEIDLALHGQSDRSLGDAEFLYSAHLLNKILDEATLKFPEQSLRIHVETREPMKSRPFSMDVFAEPVTDEGITRIQTTNKLQAEAWERHLFRYGLTPVDEASTSGANEDVSRPDDEPKSTTETTESAEASANAIEADSTIEALPASESQPESTPQPESAQTPVAESEAGAKSLPDPATLNPLLHLQLRIKSQQSGGPVARPSYVLSPDAWTVQTQVTPERDAAKAREAYRACKARRRKLLDMDSHKSREYFKKMLQNYVKKGKMWRAEMDRLDAAEEERRGGVLVWDVEEPVPRARGAAGAGEARGEE